MVKIVNPPESVQQNWTLEAFESLQSLERYTILKALDEGKRLVKRVTETAIKNAEGGNITKHEVQNAISEVIEELELSRLQGSQKPS
jgi:hypothetical protein